MSSSDLLPPLHPPGRSRTRSAWTALITLSLMVLMVLFYPLLLRISVRSLLWITRPITGLTLTSKKMEVEWGKPLKWQDATITTGQLPHQSSLHFEELSVDLSSPWKILGGEHQLIRSIQASEGSGLIDVRKEAEEASSTFFHQLIQPIVLRAQHRIESLPKALDLKNISLVIITEGERYSIDHLSCHLPQKTVGHLSYASMLIEAGMVRCHLSKGSCEATWDGKKISLRNLALSDNIDLEQLTIVPHSDRLEWGFISHVFQGLLRADGSLRNKPSGVILDGALLAERLPLERLSQFLGLKKNISGNIKEGRLTFRGSSLHLIDAEASLRLLADNIHWEKQGGASLVVAANFIGHKISITDFQLRQHDNRITGSGEMTLPDEWRKIAQAPFLLKLKATIADASQLVDFVESPESNITGKLFMQGEVHGAANHAEGYLNAQGAGITLYKLPINSLKLQLLFQGEKTELTNMDLWSGADRCQVSGTMENRWPHSYEGKASLHSSNVSEKLVPFLRQLCGKIPEKGSLFSYLHDLDSNTMLQKLHHGLLHASWNGTGQATLHQGSFDILLDELQRDSSVMKGHLAGSYGTEGLSCPTLQWQENQKKTSASLVLSPQGISLQHILLQDHHTTLLSGDLFLPLHPIPLLQQLPLSEAILANSSLAINLQLHQLLLPKENLLVTSLPALSSLTGSIQATGLLSEPSVHVALKGEESSSAKKGSSLSMLIDSKKGNGSIDATLTQGQEKLLTLNGSLPIALMIEKESAPLKESEYWRIGPSTAPLNLKVMLTQIGLDHWNALLVGPPFRLTHGTASGEILCKGTLGQPQPSGHLEFQAKELTIGNYLNPLQEFQGKLFISKEKVELTEATAFMGGEKITATGTTEWQHHRHNYHLSGIHLPFYQSASVTLKGDASLVLQGEGNEGSLQGTVNLQEIAWNQKLLITPFLIPPGITIPSNEVSLSKTSPFPLWTTDIAITNVSEKKLNPPLAFNKKNEVAVGAVDLHVVGNLFTPSLEGKIIFPSLPLSFPGGEMSEAQGSCYFHTAQPWIPDFQLTSSVISHSRQINTTLSGTPNNPLLQLESVPFISAPTLALLLRFGEPKKSPSWINQLPYWVRQQQWEKQTTLVEPINTALPNVDLYKNLGFTGCGISYRAEVK